MTRGVVVVPVVMLSNTICCPLPTAHCLNGLPEGFSWMIPVTSWLLNHGVRLILQVVFISQILLFNHSYDDSTSKTHVNSRIQPVETHHIDHEIFISIIAMVDANTTTPLLGPQKLDGGIPNSRIFGRPRCPSPNQQSSPRPITTCPPGILWRAVPQRYMV